MKHTSQTSRLLATLIASLGIHSGTVGAAVLLDLTPDTPEPFWTTASREAGPGRSIYLSANSSFTVDEISWYGGVTSNTYEIAIFQGLGTGSLAGTQLSASSASLPDSSNGPQTIPINFTFTSGLEYIVNFRPFDGISNLNGSYDWDLRFWGNGIEDADLGLVTLIDGRRGYDANIGNGDITHFSFNVVPEPTSASLVGLASIGLLALRRRYS